MTDLWHGGWITNPDVAQEIVTAFGDAVEIRAALVAPWDRGLETTAGTPVADTMWGLLVGPQAECRWRCEGDEVAVSVVSEVDLPMELTRSEVDVVREAGAPLQWLADPPPSTGAPRQRVYLRSGVPFLVRTEIDG